MVFIIIIIVFAYVFSLEDEGQNDLKKAKEDFKRITGRDYK